MIILKWKTTGWRGQFLKYFQFSEKIRVFNLYLILTLHKICQNTGFPWPVFSRIRIVDSVLIRKNTGQRIPVFWYILIVIMYSSRATFCCVQRLIFNSLLLKDIQKALNSLEKILFKNRQIIHWTHRKMVKRSEQVNLNEDLLSVNLMDIYLEGKIRFRSSPPEVFWKKVFLKYAANLLEQTHVEVWFQWSSFATLLKSHFCMGVLL